MKQTKAPKSTPSPDQGGTTGNNPTSMFVGMALDMSWRLAIVVLVPIVGGFELDQHLGTEPILVIIGFLLAIGGVALVMRQTIKSANQLPVPKKEKHS